VNDANKFFKKASSGWGSGLCELMSARHYILPSHFDFFKAKVKLEAAID